MRTAYAPDMLVRRRDIFRSRWKALIWAAGVLLTAYCSVPSPDDAVRKDRAAPTSDTQKHGEAENPWALDPPAGDE